MGLIYDPIRTRTPNPPPIDMRWEGSPPLERHAPSDEELSEPATNIPTSGIEMSRDDLTPDTLTTVDPLIPTPSALPQTGYPEIVGGGIPEVSSLLRRAERLQATSLCIRLLISYLASKEATYGEVILKWLSNGDYRIQLYSGTAVMTFEKLPYTAMP